jgi:GDP-4-dehydro-6-deoxy-D-mannose reductase
VRGRVVVTGAQGFVGTHLLEELRERAEPVDADVTDADAIRQAVRESEPEAVVHLAALSAVSASWDDPELVWRVNALGTVNVLEAVRAECPRARVLVASTGEVYGRAEAIPTPESAPVQPLSPYAASKAAAEVAALQAGRTGLDIVVARAFQHEGPGRDDRFAVGSWVRQVAGAEEAGRGALHVGNLDVRRDITDVRDVCRAYVLLLDPAVPPGVYNVAGGRPTPLRAVVDLLVGLAEVPVTVEVDPARLRRADIDVVAGDASKLRAVTGWAPRIPLEQTLRDTLDAARRTLQAERMEVQ